MNKIVVVGSLNLDTTLHLNRLPKPGETVTMTKQTHAAGGKGENQAVAAARSGAQVSFIGAVGKDEAGRELLKQLQSDRIETKGISIMSDQATGQAYIMLEATGQNAIVIQHGANFALNASSILPWRHEIESADFVIAQFETPLTVTETVFKWAKAAGARTILNPAPAQRPLSETLLQNTDLIVPNETESALISGIPLNDHDSLVENAAYFERRGISHVVITLGEKGAFAWQDGKGILVPAFKVDTVDTTAAGDTFIGALASQLDSDFDNLAKALRYASQASALAVQSIGALPSIPTRTTIEQALMKGSQK